MKKFFALLLIVLVGLAGRDRYMRTIHSTESPIDLEISSEVIFHDPAIEVNIDQYRLQHPSAALIYVNERWSNGQWIGTLLYEGPVMDISILHSQLNQQGDKTYNCILPDDWMEQMDISLEPREDLEHTYTLTRITDENTDLFGFCNPVGLCEINGETHARIYGSLRALYGEPDYETDDTEDMYQYILLAERDDGKQAALLVYSGPSGPSVSSRTEDSNMKEGAAYVLKKLLDETPPVDYHYEGYYWDGPTKVEYGVKNGQPYFHEWGLDVQ